MGFKPLGEIVSVKGGKRLPKGSTLQEEPNSHPYIRVKDMGARYIPRSGLEFVPEDVFPKISRYTVNTNDVIISIVGTIGLVSVIDEFFDNASQTENCAKLTGLDKVDALYLYYFLRSEAGQSEIKMGTVGAVQAKLPLYNIEKLSIYWPLREVRQKIVSQLSTIDDKLECNAQTNQTLEQIAQAIFKSWFVDFDPVKAKIETLAAGGSADDAELAAMGVISAKTLDELNSLKTSNPEAFNKLAQIAALFPDKLVESELVLIPEGWKDIALYDLAEYINGAAYKKFEPNNKGIGLPIVKIAELKSGISQNTGFSTVKMPEKYRLKDKDILFSWSGNPDTSIDTFIWALGEAWLNQHIFKVVPKPNVNRSYVLSLLKFMRPVFAEIARDKQTTGLGHVTVKDLQRLKVAVPPKELLVKFDEKVDSFIAQSFSLVKQNQTLELLRDNLLPKLLSGETSLTSEVVA